MNPQEIPVAKLLRIHGRVQGVGYRESMRQEAKRLNVGGWVRNRRDGTVEALVCGEAVRIEMMVAWAKQGPRYATVERVEISEAEIPPGGEFQILRSS
ncbi:MAG TPA: acylphosphatase [Methylophilaceae bacterium]|jgi:acylphosphatase|nr:acylphosphatase [Methylophilaceae bacterium]